MDPATPLRIADEALSTEYDRRLQSYRRGNLLLISGTILGVGLAAFMLSGGSQLAVIMPLLLFSFTAGTIFSASVWCCPSCRRPFTRAHRNRRCEHCGLEFGSPPPHAIGR